MKNRLKTKLKPHEAANHIARLLQGNLIVPEDPIKAVRYALVEALIVLEVEGSKDVSICNKWRCDDDGVASADTAYRVWRQKTAEVLFPSGAAELPPKIQAADSLASICLQAIERGHVIDRDRLNIPMLLQSIVGFVPDHQSKKGKNERKGRRSYLLGPITRALKTFEYDPSWKEIAAWLEHEGNVMGMGVNTVRYLNKADKEITITVGAFQNLITDAKKQLRK